MSEDANKVRVRDKQGKEERKKEDERINRGGKRESERIKNIGRKEKGD